MPERSILIDAVPVGLAESYGTSKTFAGECATGLSSSLLDPCYDGLSLLEQEININRHAAFLVHHFLKFDNKIITSEQDKQLGIGLRLLRNRHCPSRLL